MSDFLSLQDLKTKYGTSLLVDQLLLRWSEDLDRDTAVSSLLLYCLHFLTGSNGGYNDCWKILHKEPNTNVPG